MADSKEKEPPRIFQFYHFRDIHNFADPKRIAQIQNIYSQCFLDGSIDEELFISAAVTSTLSLIGVTPLIAQFIAHDLEKMSNVANELRNLENRIKEAQKKEKDKKG